MKHAILGLCIFAAACSQPLSPSAPSVASGVGAQTQASGGAANVEVTFTKWVPAFPTLAGVTGGDPFAGAVLSRDPFDNGNIVQLEARYEVIGQDAAHSFVAHIEGKQNNETQTAVFNGTIIKGWLLGAQVHWAMRPALAHRARFINTISELFRSRSNTIRVPSGDTSKF